MSRARRPTHVVIPALDEEATIAEVVAGFRARPEVERVLVIDNASRDATAARARAAGAEVLHESRPGYGAALRAGIERALERGAQSMVLVEADGTFLPEDLPLLLEPLERHDLVLGTRRGSGGVPRVQEAANRGVAALVTLLWPRSGPWLSDVGCTYRAFTREAWELLRPGCTAAGPEFSPQMICQARRLGIACVERPVRCAARGQGRSKHTGDARALVRTAGRMLRTIARERWGPGRRSPRSGGP